jgi:hypothetical protein
MDDASNHLPATKADNPRFLPVALGNGGLCFHDQRNGDAWLADKDPLDLHEWR